jgi:uncharacterized protein
MGGRKGFVGVPGGTELVVPLFPLPNVALFPRVKLPFYIFEPRYRAMLAKALDGDGLLAVPMLRAGREKSACGAPAVHETCGVGRVTDYETHDDGTSHVEILGLARARIEEELPSTPYRTGRLKVLDEAPASPEDAKSLRTDLRSAVNRLEALGMSPEAEGALRTLFEDAGDDLDFLVNVMATVVVGNPAVRQSLLEEDRVFERGRCLATLLETLRQELDQ